ncbi:MAG: DUF927 domain-containing protein [Sulfurihydrogenibium sp.]|nr:DUF927 domain-containing protein [Sulfurihydrogenibium sp.]MBX0310429.1 DUF927 domain-containing protein [Sulfurihydrogenibium sp.]
MNLQQIDFFTFSDMLGLIDKRRKEINPKNMAINLGDIKEFYLVSFNPMVIALYNEKLTTMRDLFGEFEENIFKNMINTLITEDWKDLRFTVSLYQNGKHSYNNFYKSRVIARLDTDIPMTVEEFVLRLEDTFQDYLPNILHKTYKGWHAFWLAEDWIEFKDKNLIENFVAFLNTLKTKAKATWIDRIDIFNAFTRIVNNDLPAYIYNPIVYSIDFLRNIKGEDIESDYEYITPTIQEFEDTLSHCEAFQTFDKLWETHTYDQWFVMTWLYAVKYYLSESETEKRVIYNEYIDKSLLYPNADIKEIKKQFEYALKWATEDGIIKLPSCRKLYIPNVCEKCPIFREREGYIISHLFRDRHKFEVDVNGFILRNGKWYAVEIDDDGNEHFIEVCKGFKILKIFRKFMPSETSDYLKILTNNKTYVVEKTNKTDGGINLSIIANIVPIRDKRRFRTLIENYLYNLACEGSSFVEIDFVGYRKKFGVRDYEYIVAGENVLEQDIYSILYGYFHDPSNLSDFIPAKKGNFEAWKNAYIKLFHLQEPLSLYLVGFALSHLLLDWYREETGFLLTPLVALKGESRVGKTKRSIISLALYGKPKEFAFGSITEARVKNQFGIIKTPIVIDEVVSRGNNFEKMRSLLYHIANASVKADAYKTAPPITVPVILTGEPKNFNLERLFEEAQGLIRRIFTILLKRENLASYVWDTIDNEIFPILSKNYGWIFKLLNVYKIANLNQLFSKSKTIVEKHFGKFKNTLYEDHITQLSLSFTAFRIFYSELGIEEEKIEETLEMIALYLLEKAEILADFLTSENSFEDLLLEISNKIKEAIALRKELVGLPLSQALAKADVSINGLDKEESLLLKLVFGKRYKSGNYYYSETVIVDPIYKDSDINRLLHNRNSVNQKLWEEFVALYKSLIKKKYDEKTASNLLNSFANAGLVEFKDESVEKVNTEEIEEVEF